MENLQKCFERAELLLETARQRPNKIRILSSNSGSGTNAGKWKSIHQKLADLYVEECSHEQKQKHLRNASHLLDKLVEREKISCLLVNLYPGNEGYSVMLKGRSGMDTETVRLPYEETELLQYIDNEELPPVLVDILESSQVNIFYSGCVVAEVRDYRRSESPNIFESHHVLLRPSVQTLICDINSLTSDGNKWSHEDKTALESQLLLATQEPLCLEPSVTVSYVANYLQHSKHKFGTVPMKRCARKFSQMAINRKWKFEQHAAPPNLGLYDFLARRKDRNQNQQPAVNPRLGKPGVNFWKQREVKLAPPEEVDVAMYAISIPTPQPSNSHLEFVEEYILESKQGNGKGYYCRLTISQRTLDDVYFGELYTDRNYLEGVPGGGSCWFEFRTLANVNKYLHQFIDIFTQECRKAVKISHKVKGQETIVRTIPGGQSIVFPLSTAASMSFQMGELANPILKRMSSFSKPLPSFAATSSSAASTIADHTSGVSTGTPSIVSPGCGSQGSSRTIARQGSTTGQRPPSRTMSISPVPVVSSPSHTVNAQIHPAQSQQKATNPTPPPSSRTPTPTPQMSKTTPPPPLTPIPTPSPPTTIPGLRRSQAPEVVTSLSLIGRLQSNLAGFLNSGVASDSGPALAPVSLAGVAVPISLAMVASNQPSLIVSPITNLATHAAGSQTLTAGPVSPSTVQSVSGSFAVTNTVPSSTIVVTTGMLTSPAPSVLATQGSVVSFPVGISGSLNAQSLAARLLASGLNRPTVGIQPTGAQSPFGLLQVTGSHAGVAGPVFTASSTHRPVAIKTGSVSSHALPPTSTTPPTTVTTPPPASLATVGSALMTLSSQQQHQFHLALQQNQQLASLQLQQLRQQQVASASQSSQQKTKGRKRAATTSPK